ncbi:MAG: endo alpha-1,4 polygalactosaminidase [Verrucomicrobiae bacterium]|nr:endo alpha-1,4 polygalactosaminidase [Verrucomicrobiae bacterium]MCP5543681.1 endo alpha-1,4 polygalactosaminidase [Akkermansiaceae bacterium]
MFRGLVLALGFLFAAVDASAARPTLAYVLQAENLAGSRGKVVEMLAGCGRDRIVLDAFFTGGAGGRWKKSEIATIRAGKSGRKVIAYLSIGEAEDYRSYWRREWDADKDGTPDAGAPDWLLGENPNWEGNYRVRYWDKDWQRIILRETDKIRKSGFDGVYLDIVDAFEGFEYDPEKDAWIDNRINPATGRSYRSDMVRWVSRIAVQTRKKRRGFLIVPQNGPQLLAKSHYRKTISAIGIEDLFTDGNRRQNRGETKYRLGFLKKLRGTKPVFVIEYGNKADARKRSIDGAASRGFSLLLTDRELTGLGESP